MGALLIPIIALVILLIVANYMLFKKAGEAGWKALIPLYNTYTMIRIAHGDKKMANVGSSLYANYSPELKYLNSFIIKPVFSSS